MKCYKCDRCGEVFEASDLTIVEVWGPRKSSVKYELCPKCDEWIRVALSNKESEVGRDDNDD